MVDGPNSTFCSLIKSTFQKRYKLDLRKNNDRFSYLVYLNFYETVSIQMEGFTQIVGSLFLTFAYGFCKKRVPYME